MVVDGKDPPYCQKGGCLMPVLAEAHLAVDFQRLRDPHSDDLSP